MIKYVIRRILWAVVSLLAMTVIIFLLSRALGNPVYLLLPPEATLEDQARYMKNLGLDLPLYVQYWKFLTNILQGDLGNSFRSGQPVLDLFLARFPNTLRLASFTVALAIIIGLPLGVFAAIKRGRFLDIVFRFISVFGMSVPAFWLALMLMEIFSVKLQILPVTGMGGIDHYILPGLTSSLVLIAGISRLIRSSMLDTLDSEFIKMVRSKGVSETTVIWKHALKNAIIPVISFAGAYLAILLMGAVVMETVFAWPGVGLLAYEAVRNRDYPVLQGVLILNAVVVVGINLLVDLSYGFIDPRIRYQ